MHLDAPKGLRKRKPSAPGASHSSQSCHDRFQPCLLRVTGRMEEAKERLRRAIDLDQDVRKLALDDEDLKSLWDWLAGLE
jgi:hypothetical protein